MPANAVAPAMLVGRRPRGHDAARESRPAASPTPAEARDTGLRPGSSNTSEPPPASGGSASRRGIDLGLNGGVRSAALLGGWVDVPSTPMRPYDGGLREGLAARDAERGISRSSAAQHAAYAAARRFAPASGIGVFDVTADERGIVLSVTLSSAPANEAEWQRVGDELHRLLKERRLRVAPGSRGLVARLRIETGELANDIADRHRTKRAPALGQAPLHPREVRAESTRSQLEPGQLSPTLGIASAGGGANENIRVVLIDERTL